MSQRARFPAFTLSPGQLHRRFHGKRLPSCSPQRRPHWKTIPHATAAAHVPAPPGEEPDELDESWRIYSQPGNKCVLCLGKGVVKCLYCFGEGRVRIGPEEGRDTIDCPHCESTGVEICIRCNGTGIRPSTRIDPLSGKVYRNLTNEEVRTTKQRQAKAKAEAEAKAEAKTKAETKAEAQAEARTEAQSETQAQAKANGAPEPEDVKVENVAL